MQLTGEQLIAQPQQLVWDSLNTRDIFQACIPGCESMELTAENEYKIAMVASVGPLKARFNGKLRINYIDAPNSYRLSFDGNGGMIGFGKGGAHVTLTRQDDGTLLKYETTAEVGGKIAQIGSRLVMGAAKKTADDFFAKFRQALGSKVDLAPAPPPMLAPYEPASGEPEMPDLPDHR